VRPVIHRFVPALLLLLLATATRAAAQTVPSLDEILGMPLSPGSVALLVHHWAQAPALARLGAAVRHEDANIRAAAARVMFVAGLRGMASPVMVALAKETSPEAGVEEIRFLVHFGTVDHRKTIEEAIARLGPRVLGRAAIELARNEGPAVLSRLALFRASDAGRETLSRVIKMAAKGDRSVLERVLRDVLAAGDDQLVAAVLDAAVDQDVADLPETLLLSVVTHPAPAVSIQGAWYLAQRWDGEKAWSPALLGGMQTALAAQGASPPPSVRLAREIVARLGGARAASGPEWQSLLTSTDRTMSFLLQRPFVTSVLTNRELDTAARGIKMTGKLLKEMQERSAPRKAKAPPPGARVVPSLEAASGYPPDFATDIFRVTGCRLALEADPLKSDGADGGVLTLRDDGSPASVALFASRVAQPGCRIAAYTLLATTVAEGFDTAEPQTQKTMLVPFDPAFFACQEAFHRRPEPPRNSGPWDAGPRDLGRSGPITPPTKTVNVPPTYPPSAIDDRIQGIVILEAVISHEGCITGARVTRAVDGRLDWAAVRAVLQWRFTPTLLNDVPVPVVMTVTVQFNLR